jgi:site-specific DNA-methyltransferase (adenine-specific)
MNEEKTQIADGVASELNAELDLCDNKSHILRVMTSSEDMTWATPQKWFDYLNLEFGFTLDPCCLPATAKCKKFYTPVEDGLSKSWQDERVFMNPPYGREIGKWMKKAHDEALNNGALDGCFRP